MPETTYQILLKGYVGGYDFDRATVDRELAKNDGKRVNVLIYSISGSLATGLSISAAFRNHGTMQGSRWQKYPELRSQVIDLEASLAEECFFARTDVSTPLRKSARKSDTKAECDCQADKSADRRLPAVGVVHLV